MPNAPRPAPSPERLASSPQPYRIDGHRPPDLSVVVPVYNERENIEPLLAELMPVMESLGGPFEILFIDDGSTDGSDEVLRSARRADPRIRVLRFDRNTGQTAAMSAGFAAARGDVVVTLDADLQNDPKDIPLLLARLTDHDAAVGWRGERHDSWLKRVSSRIANTVRNTLSNDDIIDTGCSLKAYRREALSRIKLFSGMHRFLPTLLRMEGLRVCQVKVGHRRRLSGDSKYGVGNRLVKPFFDLLAVRWMKRRTLRYRVTEED